MDQKKGQTYGLPQCENFEMEFDFKMGKGTVDSGGNGTEF